MTREERIQKIFVEWKMRYPVVERHLKSAFYAGFEVGVEECTRGEGKEGTPFVYRGQVGQS